MARRKVTQKKKAEKRGPQWIGEEDEKNEETKVPGGSTTAEVVEPEPSTLPAGTQVTKDEDVPPVDNVKVTLDGKDLTGEDDAKVTPEEVDPPKPWMESEEFEEVPVQTELPDSGLRRRLIAGTVNWIPSEEGWVNVHMDKSSRALVELDINDEIHKQHPPDVVADIAELTNSPEEDYDEVKCHHTLEHVERDRAHLAIEGFYRILKPGGVLDVEVPNMEAIAHAWVNGEQSGEDLLNGIYGDPHSYIMFDDGNMMFHRNGFWPEKLGGMLKEAGFEVHRADAGELQLRYRAVKS